MSKCPICGKNVWIWQDEYQVWKTVKVDGIEDESFNVLVQLHAKCVAEKGKSI